MLTHANRSTLSFIFGTTALLGSALLFAMQQASATEIVSEQVAFRTFLWTLPAVLFCAGTGYLLATRAPTSKRSALGYLLNGGILLGFLCLVFFAL